MALKLVEEGLPEGEGDAPENGSRTPEKPEASSVKMKLAWGQVFTIIGVLVTVISLAMILLSGRIGDVKEDVSGAEKRLGTRIDGMKTDLERQIDDVKTDVRESKESLERQIDKSDVNLNRSIGRVENDLQDLKGQIKDDTISLRQDLQGLRDDIQSLE